MTFAAIFQPIRGIDVIIRCAVQRFGPSANRTSDAFLEEVKAKGAYLRQQIEALDLPCFGKTRGMGLMIGIEVKEGYNKGDIAAKLIENGGDVGRSCVWTDEKEIRSNYPYRQ